MMKKTLILLLFFSCLSIKAQLIPYRIGNLWGYSDSLGKIKIKPQFQDVEFFKTNFAFVVIDSLYYGINTNAEILCGPFKYHGEFNDGFCNVLDTNKKAYYINQDGKNSFNLFFDFAESFSEQLAVVSINKKLGIINNKGQWVRKPDFDTSSRYFKSGFLMGISKGKYFYIKKDGSNLILPDSILPAAIFSENIAAVYVKKRSKINPFEDAYALQLMDTNGQIFFDQFVIDSFDYSEYIAPEKEFIDGKCILKVRNEIGWDYYFMDAFGNFSPLYSYCQHLGDSLFLGMIGIYLPDIRILNSKLYVNGQFQNKPLQIGMIGDGLIPVKNKDKKWGYFDDNCQTKLLFVYDAASQFKNGYAFVIKDGIKMVINKKGFEYYKKE